MTRAIHPPVICRSTSAKTEDHKAADQGENHATGHTDLSCRDEAYSTAVTVSLRNVQQSLSNSPLPVDDLKASPEFIHVPLEQADLNGDGEILGEAESTTLLRSIQTSCGEAHASSQVPLVRQDGPTSQLLMLSALASYSQPLDDLLDDAVDQRVWSDLTLHFGMTANGAKEVAALRPNAPLLCLKPTTDNTSDYSKSATLDELCNEFALTGESRGNFYSLMLDTHPDMREEVVRLARVFHRAKVGLPAPTRLVLSGHSGGQSVIGGAEELTFDTVHELATLFPQGAAMIRAIHVGACNAGYRHNVMLYTNIFPNLQSVWAYDGIAPTGAAPAQMEIWEQATECPSQASLHEVASPLPSAIAIWTSDKGYQPSSPYDDIYQIQIAIQDGSDMFEQYRDGKLDVTDPHAGPLTYYYQMLQTAKGHENFDELPSTFCDLVSERIGQALALRYFEQLMEGLKEEHRNTLEQAKKALDVPDIFADTKRSAILREIDSLRSLMKSLETDVALDLRSLMDGIASLSPEVVRHAHL